MSRSLNKVQIIGNLGADPEMRYTQDGLPIAGLRVATSETWTDKQGQRQERTEWHTVSMFGKLASIAQQYLRKGSKVYVEGQLKTEKYTDKQGIERYATKIVINPFGGQLLMLDGAPQGGQPGMGYGGGAPMPTYAGPQGGEASYGGSPQYGGPQGSNYAGAPQQQRPPRQKEPTAAPEDAFDQSPDFDDDIPF